MIMKFEVTKKTERKNLGTEILSNINLGENWMAAKSTSRIQVTIKSGDTKDLVIWCFLSWLEVYFINLLYYQNRIDFLVLTILFIAEEKMKPLK